jgi:hypothetical protein
MGEKEAKPVGLLVRFFWLIEEDGWEPEEPVEEGLFGTLRLEGSKLVVPATGEVLAAMDGQDCWVRPKDSAGLRWSDFSIMPQNGLLEAVFWSEGEPGVAVSGLEWLQVTYDLLRRPPQGDVLALATGGRWEYGGRLWSAVKLKEFRVCRPNPVLGPGEIREKR